MPMLTDPVQQDANGVASRSEVSSNWRTNLYAPPRTGNNAATRAPGSPSKPNDLHKCTFRSISKDSQEDKFDRPVNGGQLRGEDDPNTLQAVAEGRRLYIGNMPYIAKTRDVEMLFAEGHYLIEHINMSIDPYTGRNPSYCFVELATKEQADRAMQELNGMDFLGLPVKVGPGVARSRNKRPREEPDQRTRNARDCPKPVFDRWTRSDAPNHWKGYTEQGRRLFVGGLPRMPDHHTVNADVRELFKGYRVEAVSKVIIPRTPDFGDSSAWNHRYLFVDFSTAEDADHAAKATNGRQAWGVKIRVQPANHADSRKPGEREAWDQEQLAISREMIDIRDDGRQQRALAINMYVSWGLYVESALLFLNVLAHACILPRNTGHPSADENRGLAILPQQPSYPVSYRNHYVSFRPADVVVKRYDERIDDLWVRWVGIMTSSIPYTAAGPLLEGFYSSLLYQALDPWATQPPQQVLSMTMGRLELRMSVVMNSGVPQGIPWAFVRNFARDMMTMTRLGFVGTYEMYFMRRFNPDGPNLGVAVRLRVLWDI